MSFHETLFILGAGSHCPYGFPSASGLKREVLHLSDYLSIGSTDIRVEAEEERNSDSSSILTADLITHADEEKFLVEEYLAVEGLLNIVSQHV